MNRRFTLSTTSVSWLAAILSVSAGCESRENSAAQPRRLDQAAGHASGPGVEAPRSRPRSKKATAAEPGPFRFTDILPGSGVDFVHVSGMTAVKQFPTANGSGVAIFDFDNDGKMDLCFATGNALPLDPAARRAQPPLQEPGRRPVSRT